MRVDSIIRRASCLAVAGAIAVGFGGAAAAEGFYVGLGGGFVFPQDSDVKGRPTAAYPTPEDATAKSDRGFALTGAVGYQFAEGLRVEGELSYRKYDVDTLTIREPGDLAVFLPPGTPPAALKGTHKLEGDSQSITLMANLYYDFDLGFDFQPYVGGGVGLSRISATYSFAGQQAVDDDDTVLAYQFAAGLGYRVGGSDDRPITISLDFRHFATADPTFKGMVTETPVDAEIGENYVGIGLRFGL